MLFLFNLVPQQFFFFCISLCEINCIKIQIMSLVLNLPILFSRDSLCFVYFDVSLSATEKKFKLVEKKTWGLVQQLRLGMLRDLILQPRNFQSLNGDPSLVACFRFKQWRRGGAGCNHSDHKENTRFYRNTEIKLIVLFFLVSNFALLWKHLTMCPMLQSY